MTDYDLLILAGLIHDVGKLLQRGGAHNISHQRYSEDFVRQLPEAVISCIDGRVDDLALLVRCHHNRRTLGDDERASGVADPRLRALALILSYSDCYSAFERDDGEYSTAGRMTPLDPVFAQVSLKLEDTPRDWSYPFDVLSPKVRLQAHQPLNKAHIAKMADEFQDKVGQLRPDGDFHRLYTNLQTLLHAYTSLLPSDTTKILASIPLYDHLRTTSAIAACIYKYHEENDSLTSDVIASHQGQRFVLYSGQIVGIQNYIFDIAKITGEGGVGKRLRARSLFIQLLSDVVAYGAVQGLCLQPSNIILSSGGRFHILAPNTQSAVGFLHRLTHDVNNWLVDRFNGELWLNAAHETFGHLDLHTGRDTRGFASVLSSINRALCKARMSPLSTVLQTGNQWNADSFLGSTDFHGKPACPACSRKFPVEKEYGNLCQWCHIDKEIGETVPKLDMLVFYPNHSGKIRIWDWSVSLAGRSGVIQGDPYIVSAMSMANTDVSARYPISSRHVANYVPTEPSGDGPDRRTKDFEAIAKCCKGWKLLGYLKADVDSLGLLITEGFKRDGSDNLDSMSRIAAFSRQLDMFFSGWLTDYLSECYPECYTVFSGGDDLFIIGPWNHLLDLAGDIQREFASYTRNDELTISAGVSLVKPKFPLAAAAREVACNLARSKSRTGKSAITVLSHSMTWLEWDQVQKAAKQLSRNDATSAFLYHLLWCGENCRAYLESKGEDTSGLRYHPLLAYNIARNLSGPGLSPIRVWASRFLDLPITDDLLAEARHLDLIAGLAIFASRGGE